MKQFHIKRKTIINNFSYRNIFLTKLKRDISKKKRINRYINENTILNIPIRIYKNKVKLKLVKICNILTEEDKNNYEKSKRKEKI